MKTYITEIIKRSETEYGFFEGPRIKACCLENAQKQAEEQGSILVGELAD